MFVGTAARPPLLSTLILLSMFPFSPLAKIQKDLHHRCFVPVFRTHSKVIRLYLSVLGRTLEAIGKHIYVTSTTGAGSPRLDSGLGS